MRDGDSGQVQPRFHYLLPIFATPTRYQVNCGESQFRHPLDVMKLIILRQSKKKTENNSRFTDVHLFRPDNSLFVLAIDAFFFFFFKSY